MNKVNSDTWVGIIFLIFCSFAWWQIEKLPLGVGYEKTIGPEFFPGVMTAAVAFFSLLLVLRSIWGQSLVTSKSPAMAAAGTLARMGLFIALLVVYVFIYEMLGFLLASAIILPTGMFLLGERRLLHIFLIPCGLIILAWLVFTKVMMVSLPEFPLTF